MGVRGRGEGLSEEEPRGGGGWRLEPYSGGMRDRDLYAQILGVRRPWSVTRVELDRNREQVEVFVEASGTAVLPCPKCGSKSPRYDHRPRRWRHLDTCQYRTLLVADVPRIECAEHGVHQVEVPWAEPGSRFTALFEALVIDWLKEAPVAAVARQTGLSWDQVSTIMERAVRRGLARRPPVALKGISVDETSFAKRHEYVTVVSDYDDKKVVYVADGRGRDSLDGFYQALDPDQRAAIDVVVMDMHEAYINSTKEHTPEAITAFDKFHVAKHLGDAVDKVRRQEHKRLLEQGDERLKGTKYLWLKNPNKMSRRTIQATFSSLRDSALKTARAWALKEAAMDVWRYLSPGWARRMLKRWAAWAMRSQLEPMKRAARMIRSHLEGIVQAIYLGVTNAGAESLNARIQRVKRMAYGFRNRERFKMAIYFHLGGLDLYPAGAGTTHTKPR